MKLLDVRSQLRRQGGRCIIIFEVTSLLIEYVLGENSARLNFLNCDSIFYKVVSG